MLTIIAAMAELSAFKSAVWLDGKLTAPLPNFRSACVNLLFPDKLAGKRIFLEQSRWDRIG
jgi:hypothetical protein